MLQRQIPDAECSTNKKTFLLFVIIFLQMELEPNERKLSSSVSTYVWKKRTQKRFLPDDGQLKTNYGKAEKT